MAGIDAVTAGEAGAGGQVVCGVNLGAWSSTASALRLPREIDEISADFLTEALQRRFPGVRVQDFTIPFVHHGFTTILRLELDLADGGAGSGAPSRLIMKGGFEPSTRGIAGEFAVGPFLMEVGAYRTLPGLGLNLPDCYFAEVDMDPAAGPQIILLMEDLAERGVRFGHGLVPHSVEQVRARLSAVAAFHAKTWDSPELRDGGAFDIFPHDSCALFKSYLAHVAPPAQWERFCGMPRGAAAAVQFHDRDWLVRAMDFMIALGAQTPNVLTHGDLHAGNLFEQPDGAPGFFDCLPIRTAPMVEISYHLVNVLDHGVRRRHERELVDHYRRELIAHGASPPGLEALMFQYAGFLPFGFATFMVNSDTYQTEAFNTAHTSRYSQAMLEHGTFELIEAGVVPQFG